VATVQFVEKGLVEKLLFTALFIAGTSSLLPHVLAESGLIRNSFSNELHTKLFSALCNHLPAAL
jgi:hypothetical protein